MLFGARSRAGRGDVGHPIAIVRDVVEVVAIVAAGVWAFYVFAYENRIKPSLAGPDVNVAASMQRLGERHGLIAVGIRLQLHNIGTVRAHFLGMAVNVYGQRVVVGRPQFSSGRGLLQYNFSGYAQTGSRVPVYSYAYITHLGDPSTGQDTALEPGSTLENDRTFYVPQGRFDLLTLAFDAPYTKFDDATIPAHLEITPQGAARVVTTLSSRIEQFNISPVTSLDVR
ncbi:MAG TPA: hypothetical protein VMT95_12415 [Candidatus Binatia bacterium]|nr:hypothetical protein [Candidatus Binatia bacterium]